MRLFIYGKIKYLFPIESWLVRVQTVAELIFNSYQTTEPLVEIMVSGVFSLTPKQFVF